MRFHPQDNYSHFGKTTSFSTDCKKYGIIIFNTMNMITDSQYASTLRSQAQILKALAHPARLAVLYALRDGEHCVCHLEAHLGLRQAYLSQQLGVLREAGLVELRRDGWNIFYRVVQPLIFEVINQLGALLPDGALQPQIIPNPNCPCPACSARRGSVEP